MRTHPPPPLLRTHPRATASVTHLYCGLNGLQLDGQGLPDTELAHVDNVTVVSVHAPRLMARLCVLCLRSARVRWSDLLGYGITDK